MHISDLIMKGPKLPREDGFTIFGPEGTSVTHSLFDWRGVPHGNQDEVLSGVKGANVILIGCVILGGIKAILAGNSDHPIADFNRASWTLERCAIIGSGRRCPEAQDGVQVSMKECWIHDWGTDFDVRVFGGWAHRGGRIIAEDCLFTQSGAFPYSNFDFLTACRDLGNHIGQAVNDDGLGALFRPKTYIPGPCRGLIADTGGLVLAARCWKNHWWIRIDGSESPITDSESARRIICDIEKACPDTTEYLGLTLSDYFDCVV